MTYEESMKKVKQDRRFEKFKNCQGPTLSYEGKVLAVLERMAVALEPQDIKFDHRPKLPTDIVLDVIDFHEKMEIPGGHEGVAEQKLDHLQEEVGELIDADTSEDVLDACIDIIYVVLGLLYADDLIHAFYPAWQRVHAANMQKVPNPDGPKFVEKPKGWKAPDLKDLV